MQTDLSGSKAASAMKSYSVGASTGGSTWGASLTCTNRMQTYNAAGYYFLSPKLTCAVLASATPEKSENS